jgi:DNA-binding response OmpR family regulator
MRLLLVEDHEDLARHVIAALERVGLSADLVGTAEDASDLLRRVDYAGVILDLGLPDQDGLTVLRSLRERLNSTPVLVLTARGGVEDRIAGLKAGADDYLSKPFSLEELLARVEALLRRPAQAIGKVVRIGNLAFDTVARQIFINDHAEPLSSQELALVELLIRRSGHVVSRKHIEDQLYGVGLNGGSNAVDVAMYRLRRRLQTLGATANVCTVRGVGYFLAVGDG